MTGKLHFLLLLLATMHKLSLQSVCHLLREANHPLAISDLRRQLPDPRPGYVELERLIMVHDDVFQINASGEVGLTEELSTSVEKGIPNRRSKFENSNLKSLFGYYEDCIREEGRRIRAYGSHLGCTALETESEWVSSARTIYSIPITPGTKDLILNNSDGAAAHYYGYPVLAQWVPEESLMKFVPVLIWKLDRIGQRGEVSHRLSFTLNSKEGRLNPEVLWSIQYRQRKRIVELFQNVNSLPGSLELIQADFIGHEVKEILFTKRLPKNPPLQALCERDEGIYNRALYLSVTPNPYVKGLAHELSLLQDVANENLPSTSLDALFNEEEVVNDDRKNQIVVPAVKPLNAYQEAAVDRALESKLSVITGPPGTGKSEVVLAIMANAMLRGKSVLFASRNNGAISVVQERAKDLFGDGNGFFRLGGHHDKITKDLVMSLLNQPIHRELLEKRERASEFDRIHTDLEEIATFVLQFEKLNAEAQLAEIEFIGARSRFKVDDTCQPALFDRDKKRDLETIISKIQSLEIFKRFPVFGNWLFGKKLLSIRSDEHAAIKCLAETLNVNKDNFALEAGKNDREWSKFVLDALKVFEKADQAMSTADALEALGSLEELYEQIRIKKDSLCALSKEKLSYFLNERLITKSKETKFRQGAQQFKDIIGKKDTPEVHFEHPMSGILEAFPGWAVSNLSVPGRLPLTPSLFDLVIIDESSQCDIASSLPLMFRGKQAVIIGDPMQLGSITNLSAQVEEALLRRNGISHPGAFRYSGNSVYDLAAASAPSSAQTFLAQHYRCHPEIIGFANSSHWYDSNLEPITRIEGLKKPTQIELGVTWFNKKGQLRNEQTGIWIPEEVNTITNEVKRLLNEERFEGTVGVVTPFRRMANALQEAIEKSGIHQKVLEAAQFRADTAHKFQGDERDVIFYAPCYHRDLPNKHKWFLASQKNVFNVALSRAKSAFIVVGDKEAIRQSGIDYLEEFVTYVDGLRNPQSSKCQIGTPQRGHWEPILEKRLLDEGIPVKAQYPVGPYWLDFALFQGARQLDIEVDGEQFHKNESGMRCQKDIDRNIYVKAQGWSVMRFWVYQLRDDLDSCVEQIESWWIERN